MCIRDSFQADYDLTMSRVREHVDVDAFNAVWLQGSSLSTAEAITYAHRGRGARGRPTSGWGVADADRARRCETRQGGLVQQGHCCPAVCLSSDRAIAPHPHLRQARGDLQTSARSRGRSTRVTEPNLL